MINKTELPIGFYGILPNNANSLQFYLPSSLLNQQNRETKLWKIKFEGVNLMSSTLVTPIALTIKNSYGASAAGDSTSGESNVWAFAYNLGTGYNSYFQYTFVSYLPATEEQFTVEFRDPANSFTLFGTTWGTGANAKTSPSLTSAYPIILYFSISVFDIEGYNGNIS